MPRVTHQELREILEDLKGLIPSKETERITQELSKDDQVSRVKAKLSLAGHTYELYAILNPELLDDYWERLGITGSFASRVKDDLKRLAAIRTDKKQ